MTNLSTSLLEYYHKQAAIHGWQEDKSQQNLLEKLSHIYQKQLQVTSCSFLQRLFKTSSFAAGVYLYGPVGRGKTILMNIVFAALPIKKKQRWHFTEFMQEVHRLIERFSRGNNKEQPIVQAINFLKKEYDFLFLDELEVTEIADAMILSRLFEGLSEKGVFVFLTSNIAPDQLYRGGLHYDRFSPFVGFIQSVFHIFSLENELQNDFRVMKRTPTDNLFLLEQLSNIFNILVAQEGMLPIDLIVNQRFLHFSKATKTAVWLDFKEFGEKAYGAGDYQAIAKYFSKVFLINLPQFTINNKDQARRLITFIDCLYDQEVELYFHSEIPLDELYLPDPKNNLPFSRTLSRLIEMQSKIDLNRNQNSLVF